MGAHGRENSVDNEGTFNKVKIGGHTQMRRENEQKNDKNITPDWQSAVMLRASSSAIREKC